MNYIYVYTEYENCVQDRVIWFEERPQFREKDQGSIT